MNKKKEAFKRAASNMIFDIEDFHGYCACFECVHFKKNITDRYGWCAAFPDGDDRLPEDIFMGENDHTEIHPDQKNDIVFEKE